VVDGALVGVGQHAGDGFHGVQLVCELGGQHGWCEEGVNSKKPPYLCGKYAKPPILREIVKIHRFCANSFQYALIVKLKPTNTISGK
jgi:hypothetical protein